MKAITMDRQQCRHASAVAREDNWKTLRFRNLLLASVSAGALLVAASGAAYGQATVSNGCFEVQDGLVVCTGDLSDGVEVDGNGEDVTVNVSFIDGDIAPANNVNGIKVVNDDADIIINSDTGRFQIVTVGRHANGIEATIEDADDNIKIDHTGNIIAGGNGVAATIDGDGNIDVIYAGNIKAAGDGIDAEVHDDGDIKITYSGNINAGDDGIDATVDDDGNIRVDHTGDIVAGDDGVDATVNGDGNIDVTYAGNIKAAGDGIAAEVHDDGDIKIMYSGNIDAEDDGIDATVDKGNISISYIGNITAHNDGVDATVDGNGDIKVGYSGNIDAGEDGITAVIDRNGNITIAHYGDIHAGDSGIKARVKKDGDISVTYSGNINAGEDGIDARVDDDGNIDVAHTGNIDAGDDGIAAKVGDNGDISLASAGNITAGDEGIELSVGNDGNIGFVSLGNIDAGESGIDVSVGNDGNIGFASLGNINAGDDGVELDVGNDGNVEFLLGSNITAKNDGIQVHIGNDGNVGFLAAGSIHAGDDGIEVSVGNDGDVRFAWFGNINAENDGIQVDIGSDGNIAFASLGNIDAGEDGIFAEVKGNGDIYVVASGNIKAGEDGISAGVDGHGTATINLAGISVEGGTLGGDGFVAAAVNFEGGPDSSNILNTDGVVTLSSGDGFAVLGGDGDTTLNNYGVLNTVENGAIVLGDGHNAIKNFEGATFNVGETVDLGGAGNVFTNDGIISPGGANNIITTTINGDFIQNATGVYQVDLDLGTGESDRIDVTGTADLAGLVDTLDVQFNVVGLASREQSFVILTADEVIDNGILGEGDLFDQADGNVVLFVDLLVDEDKDEVTIDVLLDFTAPGNDLNRNQTNLAEHLNLIVDNGVGGMEDVLLALINEAGFDIDVLLGAYNQMLPEVYLNGDTASLFASEEFTNSLFSCTAHGKGAAIIREDQCVWVRPNGRFLEFDADAENQGFEETNVGISAGMQFRFAPNLYGNIAAAYESGTLDSDSGADSESERLQFGAALKYQSGPWLFASAVSGGVTRTDTRRPVAFGTFSEVAESEHNVNFLTGQLRGSYTATYGAFYARPSVDLRLTYLERDEIVEDGGNSINLKVKGANDTFFSVTPSVEVGTQFSAWSRTLRPFLRAGVTYYADNEHVAESEFLEQPGGTGTFTTTTEFSNVFADIETGVVMFDNYGSTLSLGYKGRLSDDTTQHGTYLKGTLKF